MSEFKSAALKGAASVRPTAPRPVKPTGILHFTLSVTDLERARRFYEEVVGATFWRRNDSTVFMRCGEQYFVLSHTGYHTPANRGRDTLIHHAFMFSPEDLMPRSPMSKLAELRSCSTRTRAIAASPAAMRISTTPMATPSSSSTSKGSAM